MPDIYSENLFKKILVDPVNLGYNKLNIVSGYASSLMATRHIEYLKKEGLLANKIDISLIVGMTSRDGIDIYNHNGFKNICNEINHGTFECRYINSLPPVHSKLYVWYKNDQPGLAFIGSANYSQSAFSSTNKELISKTDSAEANNYYSGIFNHSVDCRDIKDDGYINILYPKNITGLINPESDENIFTDSIVGLNKVTLTLTDRSENVPARSGLNWGQRKGREPNQAYINIPAKIRRKDFFPERGKQFLVITDDGKEFICVRAQDGGKGLHTTFNNSYLGEYFRYRMNLPNGAYIETSDLLEYGRTDVDLYKIDEETFLMDFRVVD